MRDICCQLLCFSVVPSLLCLSSVHRWLFGAILKAYRHSYIQKNCFAKQIQSCQHRRHMRAMFGRLTLNTMRITFCQGCLYYQSKALCFFNCSNGILNRQRSIRMRGGIVKSAKQNSVSGEGVRWRFESGCKRSFEEFWSWSSKMVLPRCFYSHSVFPVACNHCVAKKG